MKNKLRKTQEWVLVVVYKLQGHRSAISFTEPVPRDLALKSLPRGATLISLS